MRPILLLSALAMAPAVAAQPRRADVRVTAELIERGPAVPHCGITHFIVPMRYRVRGVEGLGLRAGDEVEVLVSCPELHRVTFAAGASHRLVLAPRRPWRTGSVTPWPGHAPAAHRWWAREVATAP